MELIYRHRNWPATGASMLVFALVAVLSSRPIARPHEKVVKPPVQVTLAELPPPPPPEPQKPTPPTPEPPKPSPPKPTPPRPQPPQPQPQVKAPVEAATNAPSAVSAPPPSFAPAPPAPPVEAPPTPPPPPPRQRMDGEYTGKVRGYLNSIKHYPSGREATISHPEGTVKIWFILKRNGELVDADIEDSSGSILLDRQALSTVRNGSYPPFPEDAFPGEAQHKFAVDMEFTPPGG